MIAPVESAASHGIDISSAIRKRPYLAAAPFLVALLVGLPLILRNAKQEFQAEASIYVSPTYYKNLQSDKEQLQVPYATLVNQQILSIRRFDVLKEAVRRLELKGVNWKAAGESEASAVARLSAKLDIRAIPDSYEVLISMRGNNKESLAPIVNTVANTFLEKENTDELSDRSSRFSTLTAARDRIEATLRQKLEQQSQVSSVLKVANLDKAQPVDDTLLAGARQALAEARRKRIEAEAQVQIMTAPSTGAGRNALTSAAEDMVASDANLRTLSNYLTQRTIDLRTKIEGLTPEHPLRQATEKEIASLNAQLAAVPKGPVSDASARLLTKLRADVDRARLLESELEKQVNAGTVNIQAVARQVQQGQGLSEEITRLRGSLGAANTAIEMTMQESAPRSLRLFSSAQTPLGPSKSNLESSVAIMMMLALACSIALCVAVDLADQRIFSPSEIKRSIGFGPVGLILEPTPETEAFADEHFWRLVNGIRRAIAVHDAKSIVFTPLRFARNPETLVADVARALSASGLKAAILETNPAHGVDRVSGSLTEISSTATTSSGAIQKAASSGASRLELGSPKDLVRVSSVGRETVDKMKIEHDVVLIDAPSLLLSADIEYLSAISDMTLIVVEAGDATRKELVQGWNILKRVGAPNIGVVMCQVILKKAGAELQQEFKWFSRRQSSERKVHADMTVGGR
jgi:capsular polysaccharide biosynthesis protein